MGRHSIEDDLSFKRSLVMSTLKWVALAVIPVLAAWGVYNLVQDGKKSKTAAPIASPSPSRPSPIVSPSPTATVSPAPSPIPTVSPSPSPSKKAGGKVQVLNGTAVQGRAPKVRDRLEAAGYDVVSTAPAARSYDKTTIFYQAGFQQMAKDIAALLGIGVVQAAPSNLDKSIPVTVVVGADYKD